MTTSSDSAETAGRTSLKRLFLGSSVGTAIEMYDFFIYGTAAALVFNKLFFPASDPLVGTLLAFATFGVGFLARPLGGAVFGHFGDRLGRKRMLVTSLMVMGISTFAIGLLPSYAQIGVLAPIILVLLRLLQGFSAGGEWAGAVLTAVEQAPANRKGVFGSWTMMGSPLGLVLATGAFQVLAIMPTDAFEAWGWRIPFLASSILVVIGLIVRLGVHEPEEFAHLRTAGKVDKTPVLTVLKKDWRTVGLGAGVNIGFNAFIYLIFTFALSIATSEFGLDRGTILIGTLLGALLQVPAILLAATASDRIGRLPVMLTGTGFLIVWSFVHFAVLDHGSPTLVIGSMIVAFTGSALLLGPMGAYFAEMFGTTVRYSGASLGYQFGAVLGGGLAPFIATFLFATSGHQLWPVALYGAAAGTVTLVCLLVSEKRKAPSAQHEAHPAAASA